MKRVLLDTSAYSNLRRGYMSVIEVVAASDEVFLSPVVIAELDCGFRRGGQMERNRTLLGQFLSEGTARLCAITSETAECYSLIHEDLRQRGRPLPLNDIWIAASALEFGLTIVTFDAHFREIPQVRVDVHPRA